MDVVINFQETEAGILVRIEAKRHVLDRLLSGAITSGVVAALAVHRLPLPWLLAAALLSGGIAYGLRTVASAATLSVTNEQFVSRGHLPNSISWKRSVPSAEVRWLEHREESGGEVPIPRGLFVVTHRKDICMLPFLSREDAESVIDRLRARFPQMAERWRGESPFGEHFTTLLVKP